MKNRFTHRIVENDIESMYHISSANWESVVLDTSHDRAVSKCMEDMFSIYGNDLNISPAIISVDMTRFALNFSEDHTKVYSTSMVLSDIGKHDLAKKFKKIME